MHATSTRREDAALRTCAKEVHTADKFMLWSEGSISPGRYGEAQCCLRASIYDSHDGHEYIQREGFQFKIAHSVVRVAVTLYSLTCLRSCEINYRSVFPMHKKILPVFTHPSWKNSFCSLYPDTTHCRLGKATFDHELDICLALTLCSLAWATLH